MGTTLTGQSTVIGQFAQTLGNLRTRKTPDTFWPVGMYRSRRALAAAFKLVAAAADGDGGRDFCLPYTPSALINVHYCLCLGARTVAGGAACPTTIGSKLLENLQAMRRDPTFQLRRSNRLVAVDDRFLREREHDPPLAMARAWSFGGTALAMAEAAAFNCYRTVTELHGPYATGTGFALVRSLNLGLLGGLLRQPELSGATDEVVHVTSFFAVEPTGVHFDFFGHPLFEAPTPVHVTTTLADDGAFVDLLTWLQSTTQARSAAVGAMTTEERAAELARIVVYSGARALQLSHDEAVVLAHDLQVRYPLSEPWHWPRSALIAAMDLNKELAGEDCLPWD